MSGEPGRGSFLGTPIEARRSRLTSLVMGPDGTAYGVAGRDGHCEVLRFLPRSGKYELLGAVTDGENPCWQVHHVAMTPEGVLFTAENDNPYRSSYLWEITL